MTDFTGRVAIVTGAARGLGRAAAARLSERGAAVAVNVRDAERAEAVASELRPDALAVPGDITLPDAIRSIVERTLERFGRIDILVNNAALTQEHATPELLERLAQGYPIPRLGTAGEVADLICFIASERAGYITGASLDINGGDLMI